ncbi:DNA-binding domain-containing protein [Neptunomonas sp. XY-337]|uniref:HvfC/BufC N-terminal domain-containing protein n=1 Tax=Neptunomonas sp. XY-337 TaxID=2561897 RepID=UPI0010AA8D24|nr:DNA-binding domain-containing protein [Neptunomonas sp. XY-337]
MSYQDSLQRFADAVLAADPSVEPYRTNLISGHAAALGNTFKLVKCLLGAETFSQLSHVYAAHYPAAHWDINRYGDQFSRFIEAQIHGPRGSYLDWSLYSDVAAIEYAITEQYYADDEAYPSFVVLYAPEKLTLSLLQQLHLAHPYTDISTDCAGAKALHIYRRGIALYINGETLSPNGYADD